MHEDNDVLAFLDIHPVRPGHSLVVQELGETADVLRQRLAR
ncbi:MAG: HIT domain-containing protein [Pseudomonadota bacterium]